ncbi:MAG: hypothetical protein LW860_14520 [Xanthomonadaceae bacterium]|jgi:hypothetical protein|nr:hypothetical protein [Xanthomonadaceae bacterium]
MRELLVLCPRMPPYNGADAQRVRTLLPFLAAHGWRATVLALDTESDAGDLDETLLQTVSDEARIVRVRAWPRRWTRFAGVRQVALRAASPMRAALDRLLATQRFDAGLVSTTDFALWPLSLRWPFPVVLDWQDPWLSTYYDEHPEVPRPGGALRYGLMQAHARRMEPRVARHAAAHLVVSDAYRTLLCTRYPDLDPSRFLTLPFAASPNDLRRARADPAVPDRLRGRRRWWVAAGRGGDDLHFACRALFEALAVARARSPARFEDFGMLFVGTAYDARRRERPIAELAARCGVADLVVEEPARIGVLETYRLMDAAEAVFVPGSDDPSYVASKLAPCLLTGQPLLAALHADSPAHGMAQVHAATRFIAFDPRRADATEALREAMRERWLDAPLPARDPAPHLGLLDAGESSAALCDRLQRVVART